MPQCKKRIGRRRCKAKSVKGSEYCVFHTPRRYSTRSRGSRRPFVETAQQLAGNRFLQNQLLSRGLPAASPQLIAGGSAMYAYGSKSPTWTRSIHQGIHMEGGKFKPYKAHGRSYEKPLKKRFMGDPSIIAIFR